MSQPDIIGIMQGRLSRPQNDKIQSFPVDNWEKEFELAAEIGYVCIEWIIDSVRYGGKITLVEDALFTPISTWHLGDEMAWIWTRTFQV